MEKILHSIPQIPYPATHLAKSMASMAKFQLLYIVKNTQYHINMIIPLRINGFIQFIHNIIMILCDQHTFKITSL